MNVEKYKTWEYSHGPTIVVFRSAKERPFAERKATKMFPNYATISDTVLLLSANFSAGTSIF